MPPPFRVPPSPVPSFLPDFSEMIFHCRFPGGERSQGASLSHVCYTPIPSGVQLTWWGSSSSKLGIGVGMKRKQQPQTSLAWLWPPGAEGTPFPTDLTSASSLPCALCPPPLWPRSPPGSPRLSISGFYLGSSPLSPPSKHDS